MKYKWITRGILILFMLSSFGLSQDAPNHGLKLRAGFGFHEGDRTLGMGGVVTLGYEVNIWRDRLRFNPSFSYGVFNTLLILDVRDQDLESLSYSALLSLDVIRFNIFSLTFLGGATLDNTFGYLGAGGDPYHAALGEVSEWSSGFVVGGGLRVNPGPGRLVLEIIPWRNSLGRDFLKMYSTMGLVLKF